MVGCDIIMKALILVGGFGTRLRPLTCTRPKPLLPIANEPIICRMIRQLKVCGVTDIVLAVHYRADQLKSELGTGKDMGVSIHYSLEKEPLGTAGPIKLAESFLEDAPFFVLNSDIVSSLDYAKLKQSHLNGTLTGTLALYTVSDPTRFGVVKVNEKNQITQFIEKPLKTRGTRHLINAGAYIFNPEILSYIPSGVPCSLEREIFPKLVDENQLIGHLFKGYWTDTGKPIDYLQANRLILQQENIEHRNNTQGIDQHVTIIPPVVLGQNCVIKTKCKIGPFVSIGNNVSINEQTTVSESIILSNTKIGKQTTIEKTILGENVEIGNSVRIKGLVVIGDFVTIKDKVTIHDGVTIYPKKTVKKDILNSVEIK